jgi:prevent-host-death family protein
MTTVTVHAAKTHLSKLIERAERGEDVVIARRHTPVVRLVPIAGSGKRQFGSWRGRARVTADFFKPLPSAELDAWER